MLGKSRNMKSTYFLSDRIIYVYLTCKGMECIELDRAILTNLHVSYLLQTNVRTQSKCKTNLI